MPTLKVKNNGIWETVSGIGGSGGSGGSGVAVQSDYAQNDSSAMDYIKNRPFYIEKGVTIFDQEITTELMDGANGYTHSGFIGDPSAVSVGDAFGVTVDGTEYICEITEVHYDLGMMGNLYIFYELYLDLLMTQNGWTEEEVLQNVPFITTFNNDTGEPFLIMYNTYNDDTGATVKKTNFMIKEAGTYHFTIEGMVIHKLDKKFLPEIDALPSVSTNNNGQTLAVVNGAWAVTDAPSSLPKVTTADNDKVLMVINGAWVAGSIANGDEVYY